MDEISKNVIEINSERNSVGFAEYLKLGDDYLDENDSVKAAEYYELATNAEDASIGSLSVDRRIRIADTLFAFEKCALVLVWLEGLFSEDAIIRVGDCYFRLSEYDKALEKYQFVDPNLLSDEQKLFVAGRRIEHDPDDALWYYSCCSGKDSDHRIIIAMGDCYMAMKQTSNAIEQYKKSLSIMEDRELAIKIADILYDDGKYKEALEYYLKYVEDIGSQKVSSCVLKCYLEKPDGEFAKSIIDLFESKELYSFEVVWCTMYVKDFCDYAFAQQKVDFFLEKGHADDAANLCEALVSLTIEQFKRLSDYKFVHEIACWLEERGFNDIASKLYDQAIDCNLGMCEFLVDFYKKNDPDTALKYFKAIENNSNGNIKVSTLRSVISIYEKKTRRKYLSRERSGI